MPNFIIKHYTDPVRMFKTLPPELWHIIMEYYYIIHIKHLLTFNPVNDYILLNKQYPNRKLYAGYTDKTRRKLDSQFKKFRLEYDIVKLLGQRGASKINDDLGRKKYKLDMYLKNIENRKMYPEFKQEIYEKLRTLWNEFAKDCYVYTGIR